MSIDMDAQMYVCIHLLISRVCTVCMHVYNVYIYEYPYI